MILALVFPAGDVGELIVVTKGFTLGGLELMARDAHDREESCGGHFRLEHQTPEGEALRHDDKFAYVSCWEYQGEDQDPVLLKEPLDYEFVVRQQRNYKN